MSWYRTCPLCGAQEEAAAGTANTGGGKVEHGDSPVPSYHTTDDKEDAR